MMIILIMPTPALPEYYLEVVHKSEEPQFPEDLGSLIIGQQKLTDEYIQYWAYPKESELTETDLPPAETIASQYPTPHPSLLINQLPTNHRKLDHDSDTAILLELIVVKDGHAWAKTVSNFDNFEESTGELLDYVRLKYQFEIDSFLTTDNVTEAVNRRLDKIGEEESSKSESVSKSSNLENLWEIKPISHTNHKSHSHPLHHETLNHPLNGESFRSPLVPNGQPKETITYHNLPSEGKRFSKFGLIIPIIVLALLSGGAVLSKDKIIPFVNQLTQSQTTNEVQITPSPTPTPTPTPLPFDRSSVVLRVQNGTKKTGAAGALSKELTEIGWKVSQTGNAKDQNTSQTTIKAKTGQEKAIEQLLIDLSTDYEATVEGTLKDTDKADLELTIGKK